MAEQQSSPYVAHLFVCTNDRGGERASCADHDSQQIKARLKDLTKQKGWQGKVRVSTSGCMGLCDKGPNVMIYPQELWFSSVTPDDLDVIIATLDQIMRQA